MTTNCDSLKSLNLIKKSLKSMRSQNSLELPAIANKSNSSKMNLCRLGRVVFVCLRLGEGPIAVAGSVEHRHEALDRNSSESTRKKERASSLPALKPTDETRIKSLAANHRNIQADRAGNRDK